jgi:dTDP-4-amino-4,6-dideoxygalactose transaminase
MSRPFLVFGAPLIEEAEIAEVVDSLRSGWLGTGPKVARFEDLFRRYTGAEHAIAISSCTAALHLCPIAAGIGPGSEVITTAMTFVATANAIVHAGAVPILTDCDRRTGLMDPERVEAAVTPRTRAIIPVHLYGRPCADGLMDIARRHDLVVIEDAAHAIEASYRGRKIGTIGHMTAFSFYVTKNMTTGEGGMVTTASPSLAESIRRHALHGLSHDAWARFSDAGYRHYTATVAGFKYNMTDLQAALGIHQLGRIRANAVRRETIWARYDDAFASLPVERPAPVEADTVHGRHLYTILVDSERTAKSRDRVLDELVRLNIGTGVHYTALHLHPYYRETLGHRPGDFPNAERIGDRTMSLPLSAKLTDRDVEDVIAAVRQVVTSGEVRRR